MKKKGMPINKKRVSKSSGVKGAARSPVATFPKTLMSTPIVGSMPSPADAEMKRLMNNRGVPRKKVS